MRNAEHIVATASAEAVAAPRITELEREVAKLTAQLDWYAEQFNLSRQRQFGRKLESFEPEYEQLTMEAEASADPAAAEPDIEEVKSYSSKKRTHAEGLPENLPVLEEVTIPLTDDQRAAGPKLVRMKSVTADTAVATRSW